MKTKKNTLSLFSSGRVGAITSSCIRVDLLLYDWNTRMDGRKKMVGKSSNKMHITDQRSFFLSLRNTIGAICLLALSNVRTYTNTEEERNRFLAAINSVLYTQGYTYNTCSSPFIFRYASLAEKWLQFQMINFRKIVLRIIGAHLYADGKVSRMPESYF